MLRLEHVIYLGFYDRLVALIDYDETRRVALRALNAISLTPGKGIPSHFLKGAPIVLKLALRYLDDPDTLSIITSIFSHSSISLRKLAPSSNVAAFYHAVIDALKDAAVTAYMFDHAIVFFGNTFCDIIEEAGDIFSSIVALQIALLHSQDLLCRVRAITILCDDSLYSSPSPEKKPMVLDSGITRSDGGRHCVSTVRIAGDIDLNNLPSKFARAVKKYGRNKTQIATLHRAKSAFASVFLKYSPDTDLAQIGRALADLILRYQHALPDLICWCCGNAARCADCRQVRTWPELVQKCVEVLRGQAFMSEKDTLCADILQWRLECDNRVDEDLWNFCESMRAKHPQCPLFYYIPYDLDADLGSVLQLSRRGLKCPKIPDWLRFALLDRAAQKAFGLATTYAMQSQRICYAFLLCAFEDTRVLLKEAPPDDMQRARYLSIHVMSCMALEGAEVALSNSDIKVGFMPS